MPSLHHGKAVIVKGFDVFPVILKLWSVGRRAVFLMEAGEYEKRIAGKPSIEAVSVPIIDCFDYNKENTPITLDFTGTTKPDWDSMTPLIVTTTNEDFYNRS